MLHVNRGKWRLLGNPDAICLTTPGQLVRRGRSTIPGNHSGTDAAQAPPRCTVCSRAAPARSLFAPRTPPSSILPNERLSTDAPALNMLIARARLVRNGAGVVYEYCAAALEIELHRSLERSNTWSISFQSTVCFQFESRRWQINNRCYCLNMFRLIGG